MFFVILIPAVVIFALDGCFTAIPQEFHRIRRELVWYMMIPACFWLAATILIKLETVAGVLALISLVVDMVLRIYVSLGLARSFRDYFAAQQQDVGKFGYLAGLLVCCSEVGAFLLSVAASARFNPEGGAALGGLAAMAWMGFILVLIMFLGVMGSYRNRVLDIERANRHKRVLAITKPKARPAYSGEEGGGGVA